MKRLPALLFSIYSPFALAMEEPEFELEESAPNSIVEETSSYTSILKWLEVRHGQRMYTSDLNESSQMSEVRSQFGYDFHGKYLELQFRTDVYADRIADEAGADIRELKASPVLTRWMNVSVGRQVISWAQGDILSVNDYFPKDYNAFFIGRDAEKEYMKLPSDAIQANFYSNFGALDIVYTPRFQPYELPTGERLSYYSPLTGAIEGESQQSSVWVPDTFFEHDVINLRYSAKLGSHEVAVYFHDGYWPVSNAIDATNSRLYHSGLRNLGGSYRGPLLSGIVSVEAAYYDSKQDKAGTNPYVPNDQIRGLIRFDRELIKNLNLTAQYYAEQRQQQAAYEQSLLPGMEAKDELYQLLSLRLTQTWLQQTLTLSFFTFYSPTDEDFYLRANLYYQPNDHWLYHLGLNQFGGVDQQTRWAQYEQNSNIFAGLRYYW